MKKVDLNIILKNDEIEKKYNRVGIFDEKSNILKYSDENIEYTIDFNKNVITRENNEFKMDIDCSKHNIGKISLFYKELSKNFVMDIYIKELKNSTNIFSVKYLINDSENVEYYVEILNK